MIIDVGTDVPTVVDYHYLLWQELNKAFGSTSSIFVMEVGKRLCHSDYSITHGHADLAAHNTFQLVDCSISCATNYTPNGSSISAMWKKLLLNQEGSGETTHADDLSDLKRGIYVDNTTNILKVCMVARYACEFVYRSIFLSPVPY